MMQSGGGLTNPARLVRFGSWVIALVFAVFLNMLGSLVIRDMAFAPRGGPPTHAQFTDATAQDQLKERQRGLQAQKDALDDKVATLQVVRKRAAKDYADQKEGFQNWLATRTATGDSTRDPDLLTRTQKLDTLRGATSNWQHQIDAVNDQQRALAVLQNRLDMQIAHADAAAEQRLDDARRRYALKVFGLRLAVTLPIVLLAVWLFIRYRKARNWPFVYGFGLFALSAFFVELVPYLPDFGGYVRVIVGIALTVFSGLYMMRAFQRYAERKRLELQQDQGARARSIGYEKAVQSLAKKRCPSCDKQWNVGGEDATFCVHCGLRLFNQCGCGGRNFFFFPHCHQCGTAQVNAPTGVSE